MTTQPVPNHSDDSVLIELYGPENDGWYTSRISDWIGVCDDLRDPDARGYLVLRALVYEKFKKPVRNLTLAILCELIPGPNGKPSSQGRVRGILKALSDVGLISTPEGGPIKTSSRPGAAGKPLRIRINDMPKEGYAGWRNVEAKLKWLQAGKPDLGAGQNSDPADQEDEGPEGAGQNSDPLGQNSDPHPRGDVQEPEHPLVPSLGADDGPDGRSPGERRRPSTGSSERASESGCAASGKDSPSPSSQEAPRATASKSRVLTDEQRQARDAILPLLPPHLLEALGNVVPQNVCQAMVDALAAGLPRERTPQQLVDYRVLPRWNGYWASKFYAGELTPEVNGKKRPPFGPLLQMLEDTDECRNLTCEDRHDFVLGDDCRNCAMRKDDRKADQKRERREAQEEADRQARRGEEQAAAEAGTAAAGTGDAPAGPMPTPRNETIVVHSPKADEWWDC
ncbi:hypothetical protein, partial [Streptomyces prasinopilosus]|uniref:hypothetical protein n=1 Tax=Streptomyces prasinopilosus TaxID=67344 RepID=UPI000ACAECFE